MSEPNSSVDIDKTKTERLSLLDLTSASTSTSIGGSTTLTSNADEDTSGTSFSSAVSDMPVKVVKLNIMEELKSQNAIS